MLLDLVCNARGIEMKEGKHVPKGIEPAPCSGGADWSLALDACDESLKIKMASARERIKARKDNKGAETGFPASDIRLPLPQPAAPRPAPALAPPSAPANNHFLYSGESTTKDTIADFIENLSLTNATNCSRQGSF